ncbi:hypothetical protein OG426_01715 [Streptomyces canus]|uniref:hypothetical protein n=1 Tax=Streptomyces canus TaxID=58343 RepID=UPI00224D84E0|nr:hypothetical protein [Streptomyces canus]MCX4853487.1 hypothetical protein [Streptomyces canus]WSW31315.1 hypothetical protein OG426_01715 [Streptomyces canus]
MYSSVLTGILAPPPAFAPRAAEALTADDRPALAWLEFQDCADHATTEVPVG